MKLKIFVWTNFWVIKSAIQEHKIFVKLFSFRKLKGKQESLNSLSVIIVFFFKEDLKHNYLSLITKGSNISHSSFQVLGISLALGS